MATYQVYLPKTPYETFNTVVDNKSIQMIFVWNERERSYAVTISDDSGVPYVEGRRLVPWSAIDMTKYSPIDFTGYFNLLPIVATDDYSKVSVPEDIGKQYGLYYVNLD